MVLVSAEGELGDAAAALCAGCRVLLAGVAHSPKRLDPRKNTKDQGPCFLWALFWGIILGHHLGAEFLKTSCPKGRPSLCEV